MSDAQCHRRIALLERFYMFLEEAPQNAGGAVPANVDHPAPVEISATAPESESRRRDDLPLNLGPSSFRTGRPIPVGWYYDIGTPSTIGRSCLG